MAVDVRPESPTYGKHVMVQMSADNRRALFLPPYVAHGFQTLADNTEVLYQASEVCEVTEEQGFRWNEPEFGIEWPVAVSVISEKDANWPLLASVRSVAPPTIGKLPIGRNESPDGAVVGKGGGNATAFRDTLTPLFARRATYKRENRPA